MTSAILERTFGCDPSSKTIAQRYLKLATVSTFSFDLYIDAMGALCH